MRFSIRLLPLNDLLRLTVALGCNKHQADVISNIRVNKSLLLCAAIYLVRTVALRQLEEQGLTLYTKTEDKQQWDLGTT